MRNSAILTCSCDHPKQDEFYGYKRRVFNLTIKGAKVNKKVFRCTVCTKEREE